MLWFILENDPRKQKWRVWGGKANPKVYHWAVKCSGQMGLSPAGTYWAAVGNTPYLEIMGHDLSTGSQSPLVQGCPRTINKLLGVSRFAHVLEQWSRLPQLSQRPINIRGAAEVRLHLCTAGCHSNTWNKKVWCERSIRDVLYNVYFSASQTWACVRLP